MLEYEAMAWLEANGLPVPEFRFAPTLEGVLQACAEIGYPVVMKMSVPGVTHKSEVGGVLLDLGDEEAVRAAFDKLMVPDAEGVNVQKMLRGGREVVLGFTVID